jgi:hypothetical protein
VEAVDRATKDDAIRVIVITGGTPGPNAAFCSGADLAPPSREESPQKSTSELLDDTDWIGQFHFLRIALSMAYPDFAYRSIAQFLQSLHHASQHRVLFLLVFIESRLVSHEKI